MVYGVAALEVLRSNAASPGPEPGDLRIERVSKAFGDDILAVDGVTLAIGHSEFFTLLGPSGCGKTTLLRMIAGFEIPDSGNIWLRGIDLAGLPPNKRPINTVFQSYALFPHMSVRANIGFGLEMLGLERAAIRGRVDEMLALVRLVALADRMPIQLSGGQQQRVALARALAPAPDLLLLDEPLSALDQKLRREMQGELKRLQRETGIAFVLVTHDQEEALAMSDRLGVMLDGRLQQIGTPQEVYDRPTNRFVADFIGEANLIDGPMLGKDEGVTAIVRPERVSVVRADATRIRARGQVIGTTFLGADTLYEIRIRDDLTIRSRVRGGPPLEPGAEVAVDWPEYVQHMVRG